MKPHMEHPEARGAWRLIAALGAVLFLVPGCALERDNPWDKKGANPMKPDAGGLDGKTRDQSGLAYVEVRVGLYHTCARITDGKVVCWGGNPPGHLAAKSPSGTFLGLDTGTNHSCGIRSDNTIHCWGNPISAVTQKPETNNFEKISCGNYHCCALTKTSLLKCWGDNQLGQTTAPTGTFKEIAAGANSNCAIDTSGKTHCWGQVNQLKTTLPPDKFSKISVDGGNTACGIVAGSGTLKCWGLGTTTGLCKGTDAKGTECGQGIPPAGKFQDVSTGIFHSCGIQTSGLAVCWGQATKSMDCSPDQDKDKFGCGQGTPTPPPSKVFYKQIDVSHWHSCGVLTDGTVACWGWTKYKQHDVPPLGSSGPG